MDTELFCFGDSVGCIKLLILGWEINWASGYMADQALTNIAEWKLATISILRRMLGISPPLWATTHLLEAVMLKNRLTAVSSLLPVKTQVSRAIHSLS